LVMRKQNRKMNLYQNRGNFLWREKILFKGHSNPIARERKISPGVGEQQHIMGLTSCTVRQIDKEWVEGHIQGERLLFEVEAKVFNGGIDHE
jgi:hypothetical protein